MSVATPDQANYLYLYINVYDSEDFKREDLDIYSEADLSICQAVMGGMLWVKGLFKDTLQVPIERGTGSHKMVTVRGEGIKVIIMGIIWFLSIMIMI